MKVDLICIGAAKSGTTWLSDVLNQHPDVYIAARKEVHYFNPFHPITFAPNKNRLRGEAWYHGFFDKALPTQIKADFSTSYLQFPSVASDLSGYNPNAKVMVMLRNPCERAFSYYNFLFSRGLIGERDFLKAFHEHKFIGEGGLYYKQLLSFFEAFSADQIGVFFFDELRKPEKLMNRICEFLEIETFDFQIPDKKINETKGVRRMLLHSCVTSFKLSFAGQFLIRAGIGGFFNDFYDWNSQPQKTPALSEETSRFMLNFYREDIMALSEKLDYSLDHWLSHE